MKVKALILAVLMIVLTNVPVSQRLTITDQKTGHIVFQGKTDRYEEFYVSFIHSVNRTPVNEYYRISGHKLVLEKVSFYSYGAGMPEVGEYGSGKPSIKDGLVQIEGINQPFERFTYVAGTFADHSLNTDYEHIHFTEFVKSQTPVTFEVKRISLIKLLGLIIK